MTPLIRNIFFAIGALAILTGVVVGAYWIRGAATDRPRSAVEASQDVLVAAKAIPVGTLLREEDLAWRSAPGVKRPQGSFRQATTSKAELVGAVARRSFTEGEILTGAGILRPTDRGFLAATLNPGFRAVTLPIEAAQSASGLVLPGDHVDVILVQEFDGGSRSRSSVGEVILRNARIVAVGRTFEATINTSPTASTPAVQRTANTSAAAPRTITL
jgi:pilus assembly protein CpaB